MTVSLITSKICNALLRLYLYQPRKTVLYIGVTNDLANRLAQHYANRGEPGTFAGKYFCYNLLYFEEHQNSLNAIAREKELKGWTRAKKDALIDTLNPAREFLQS